MLSQKCDLLITFLELPNGVPSHDTFNRVFALLKPTALQEGFIQWVKTIATLTDGRLVAIDGKTARHSFDHADSKGPLHMVSAWVSENRMVLGQLACDSKSNEITAIPELLKKLEISGSIVTIDAMGCQKAIADAIVNAKADYVLAVKDNQPTLHADIERLFEEGCDNNFKGLEHHSYRTEERGHGRKETRFYHILRVPKDFAERHSDWAGLRSIGMVYSERQEGDKEPTFDARAFLCSLPPKAKQFAQAVRSHWGIETSLHWVLDVSFREDDNRLHKGHGQENLGSIRRLTASLLQNETSCKAGIECKRKCAAWSDQYLLKVLAGILQ
jgi:predicted transposase YbfD/YdcC